MAAFENAFEQTVRELLTPADLERVIETDGGLDPDEVSLPFAELLAEQAWGQGFAAPSFLGEFEVVEQKIVGGRHLKLRLRRVPAEPVFNAILFGREAPLPSRVSTVYRVQVNEFNGMRSVQLVLDHWQPGNA